MDSLKHATLIAELQKEYLASFKEKFQCILDFHKKEDWYRVELEYHNLKGTGTTYEVPEVTELCQQMEQLCQEYGEIKKEWLEISIELLKKIIGKYRDKKPFELSKDPGFIEIKSLQKGLRKNKPA